MDFLAVIDAWVNVVICILSLTCEMVQFNHMTKIRTRFAPSPTGSMHIGNLRTAFYAYALAKHNNGDFILRIEDTDKKLEKEVSWDTNIVGEATLLKSDGFPTYHLAVVVDDNDMKISHTLRGHDWMPSTPIHLLVYKYLGFKVPEIGHLTDILDPDGGKLSKRKGSVSVEGLLKEGYIPEALLNFVILLGWAPKDNKELFTLDEFVNLFDPLGFQKANPIFNRDKLDWFNGEYIRKISNSNLCKKFEIQNSDFKKMDKDKKIQITKLVKERIKKIS